MSELLSGIIIGFASSSLLLLAFEWWRDRKPAQRKVQQCDYYNICKNCTADSYAGRNVARGRGANGKERTEDNGVHRASTRRIVS